MKDQTVLMQLSAYADGELAPGQARAFEVRMVGDASLAQELSLYTKLKTAAAALPVPSFDACLKKKESDTFPALSVSESGLDKFSAQAGQAINNGVPCISDERFSGVWKKIAARTAQPPIEIEHQIRISAYLDNALSGSERLQAEADFASEMIAGRAPEEMLRQWKRLGETAATLGAGAPVVSEFAWMELWHEISQRTVAMSVAERAAIARLELAVAELPVPQIPQARWDSISERLQAAAPELAQTPPVSAERWGEVWDGVAQRIRAGAETKTASPIPSKIQKVDFKPSPAQPKGGWGWKAAASLVAVAMFALLLTFVPGTENTITPSSGGGRLLAMHIPEVLDERYQQVQVEYLPGQQEPVLCFFLKNDELKENDPKTWEWMPN